MINASRAFKIILSLAAFTSSYWYFSLNKTSFKLDEETLAITSDAQVSKLQVRKFDERGQLERQMTASSLRHIPKENKHYINEPHITLSQNNKPAWEVNALRAQTYHGSDEVTFYNQVVVHQYADSKHDESSLKTERLTYHANDKTAETKEHVRFEQPGSVLYAKGMKVFIEQKRIQLLSQARGIYAAK